MRFWKWHALGNSYLLVERSEAGALTPARARALCDVRRGIGSDGVLELVARTRGRAEVTIWNPDGSIAEMSGNGVRIAAGWLARADALADVEIVTAGVAVSGTVLDGGAIRIDLGSVRVGAPETIVAGGEEVELVAASVGNPHAVIRVHELSRDELLRLGPAVERHPRFPARTNVQLARPRHEHGLDVLVWERGAGETSASGSSAVAAAAVAVSRGWCASPVTVHLPGGDLLVELAGERALLTGPAVEIGHGSADL